jgi:MerR family mercuric resistance operon transcriptional regulator
MTSITIGQLARRVGLRPSAIRYYEAQGILRSPDRSAKGYRLYGPEAIIRLQFIRRSKELGFSLDEVRQLIERSRNQPPCALSRELIERHLAEVESELHHLRSLRDRLKRLLHLPPPAQASDGVCPLIEGSQKVAPTQDHASSVCCGVRPGRAHSSGY